GFSCWLGVGDFWAGGGGGGGAGGGGAPAPHDSGTKPLSHRDRAEAGDYVALGDSYSAGEGAFDYLPGTDEDDNQCHRSAHAYGSQVYDGGDFAGDFVFGACSGGVVADYYGNNTSGNAGEGPQRDQITDDTSLITISMGGNDFGFATVLEYCVRHNCDTEEYRQQLEQTVAATQQQLVAMYQDMRDRAGPDAVIVVVGYPHLFVESGDHDVSYSSTITGEERQFLNEVADMADQAIQDAIGQANAGVEFVDIRDDFAGHEVGSDDPWIHDLDIEWDWFNTHPAASSFHPTAAGQSTIADAVNEQIDEGP
ncbi:SGNH/GDSL hydrolase family protein, partial [Nocardioides sp.]|uniref:SGNH/GDSL hydrolase family protein n=1 Tax=Nocardioides sp. TaxID=35761 RepID=UPI0039E651C7